MGYNEGDSGSFTIIFIQDGGEGILSRGYVEKKSPSQGMGGEGNRILKLAGEQGIEP